MSDLIDRQELLMDNSWTFYDENGNRNEACIAVENAPTVDAEPVRHGRWDTKYLSEDEDWSGIEHTIGRCSVCRGKIDIVGERIPYLYCPFCGAKMQGDNDGNK